ncbi:MAG: hypothetical protein M1824_005736 [Vezdaea acicularis]|nr:MAG: hypothetical protein M1824_005736 [Vezdaea acicularis]
MQSVQRVRRLIVSISIVATTALGTWYGAGLKTQRELSQADDFNAVVSTEKKIDLLQQRLEDLKKRRAKEQDLLTGIERRIVETKG